MKEKLNNIKELIDLHIQNTAICVPVHNATECVQKLLEDLNNTVPGLTKVFVDDNSLIETRKLLLEQCIKDANSSYLRNNTQQLFTRALNRCIRSCPGNIENFICLNTDCELKPGWHLRLLECLYSNPNTCIVGYPDGEPVEAPDQEAFYPSRPTAPDYITGHCFVVPRWAFNTVGLFIETDLHQAHIASERLWCWRATEFGYRMFYVHSPLVIHNKGGPSWGRDLGWLQRFNYAQLWPGKDIW